jgi:hypothetical protein
VIVLVFHNGPPESATHGGEACEIGFATAGRSKAEGEPAWKLKGDGWEQGVGGGGGGGCEVAGAFS